MTIHEQQGVTVALTQLAEVLDAPLSPTKISGYLVALDDLDARAVVASLQACLRTSTFFPRPAEIRAMVQGTTDDAADLAWGDVLKAIRSCGRYGDPRRMLDETAHAAMLATFGSWGAACDMSLDGAERQGCAKQFRAVYGATVRRQQTDALTPAELPEALRHEARALLGGR